MQQPVHLHNSTLHVPHDNELYNSTFYLLTNELINKHSFAVHAISQLPKLCVKITIFMQGHVLIADWSVANFVVIVNDVMNDNMAAFAHVGARLGAFFYWTRFLENNEPFDNIPL